MSFGLTGRVGNGVSIGVVSDSRDRKTTKRHFQLLFPLRLETWVRPLAVDWTKRLVRGRPKTSLTREQNLVLDSLPARGVTSLTVVLWATSWRASRPWELSLRHVRWPPKCRTPCPLRLSRIAAPLHLRPNRLKDPLTPLYFPSTRQRKITCR